MEEKEIINAEEIAEETAEEVVEEITEEVVEETTEEVAEEATEEAVEETTEEVVEETTEEIAEEATEEVVEEATEEVVEETAEEAVEEATEEVAEETAEEVVEEATEETSEEEAEEVEEAVEEKQEKTPFKLTLPANLAELEQKICAKRGRKLIYKPNEVLFEISLPVLGTDKKNEEGIKIKDIINAEIKEGLKLGYLDKFDGLKASEIKEEYENEVIYELAEQEFRKMGVIYEDGVVKVYLYDWDRKGMHHVGKIDAEALGENVKYFEDKEKYSFDICGIITGGKGKRVSKDESGKIKITKENGEPIGIELDVTIVNRKD